MKNGGGNRHTLESMLRITPHAAEPLLFDVVERYRVRQSERGDQICRTSWRRLAAALATSPPELELFRLFMAYHGYLHMIAQWSADLSVDLTRVGTDQKYRERLTRKLARAAGLGSVPLDVGDTTIGEWCDSASVDPQAVAVDLQQAAWSLETVFDARELSRIGAELLDDTREALRHTARNKIEVRRNIREAPTAESVDALMAERDWFAGERDAAITMQFHIMQERDAALAERDRLAGEIERLCSERDAILAERRLPAEKRDHLLAARDGALANPDRPQPDTALPVNGHPKRERFGPYHALPTKCRADRLHRSVVREYQPHCGQSSPTSWPDLLSEEARRLALFLLSHSALEPALRSPWIVDVVLRGAACAPLLPDAIAIEVGAGDPEAHRIFDNLDGNQQCILLHDVIQYLPDYRSFLAGAFDRLAIGGYLIIIVPHQFLYERKWQMPSRYDHGHLRFYTPSTLSAEIEEALDPCRYRVRLLADHDTGFDYDTPLHAVPSGGHDIVLCLQKIAQPSWQEDMDKNESQSTVFTQPTRFVPYDVGVEAYRVIAPDDQELRRMIVLKLDHRGDFIITIPAFRILRKAFPSAVMTLICGSWNWREAERLNLFDRVIPFEFFAEDPSAKSHSISHDDLCRHFAKLVDGERYDVAIDLRLYDETRELLRLIDARHKAGFDPYDRFPWLTISMNPLISTLDGAAEQRMVLSTEFHSAVGEHNGFAIIFRGHMKFQERQHLCYGPYITLKPGHYELEVLAEAAEGGFEIGYDLSAGDGQTTLDVGLVRIERDRFPRILLFSSEPIKRFEFRMMTLHSGALPPFRFMGLRYRRRGAYVGVHQREAMALLAHLVSLRLQYPYATALL